MSDHSFGDIFQASDGQWYLRAYDSDIGPFNDEQSAEWAADFYFDAMDWEVMEDE